MCGGQICIIAFIAFITFITFSADIARILKHAARIPKPSIAPAAGHPMHYASTRATAVG